MLETDHDLLTAFARERDESAFRQLVERHLPVVWSCARRTTNGDHSLAEDVAQQVFADLAVKATTLPPGMPLGGWLHRHAFFTATKAIRAESRRRARESLAATMSENSADSSTDDSPEGLWGRLAPHLDSELAALSAEDRSALVLRYFEKRSLRSVASVLGVSEDAARKRIDRTLEKLRRRLGKKGVSLASGATLAALLPPSVVIPPAGLAAGISTVALKTAAGIGVGTISGSGGGGTTVGANLGSPSVFIGVAAGLALIASGWWWARRHSAIDAPPEPPLSAARRPPPVTIGTPAPSLPPLHATAFLVPDTLVAARLLAPPQEWDERALHDLVVRSAQQGGGQVIEISPVTPPVVGPGNWDQQAQSQTAKGFRYPVEFNFASDGTPTPAAFATRPVGTVFKVNGRPAQPDGTHAVSFSLEHHLAPPGETRWSSDLADPAAEHVSVVSQPRFHVVELSGSVSLRRGETRLGGATLVPGWLNPRKPGTAERLLVFLTLESPSSQ